MSETTLSADGSYSIDHFPTEIAAIVLSGAFGGGVVTIKVKQSGGVGTDATFDTVSSAYAQAVRIGVGNKLTITLTGSTSPTLLVQAIPLKSENA